MRKFLRKVFIVYLAYLIGLSSMAPARRGQTPLEKTMEVTVLNPKGLAFKEFGISLRSGRNKIPFFENKSQFRFRVYAHKKIKPLIFLVPGLGARIKNRGTNYVAEVLFQAGYHVLIVPNNITEDFAIQVSRSGMPGVISEDAKDLTEALIEALKVLKHENLKWSETHLLGYSMGALLSGFIAFQNDSMENRPLDIKKTIMINPPLDVVRTIERLDLWYERLRGKAFLYRSLVEVPTLLSSLWGIIQTNRTSRPTKKTMARFGDLMMGIPQEQLQGALAYGLLRRFARFVHATQQVNDQGVFEVSDLGEQSRYDLAAKVSLSQYTYEFLGHLKGVESIKSLSKRNNFWYLTPYLEKSSSIYMLHNADDVIVDPASIKKAARLFKQRSHIFPTGGHIGNMWEDSFRDKIIEFIEH